MVDKMEDACCVGCCCRDCSNFDCVDGCSYQGVCVGYNCHCVDKRNCNEEEPI